MYTFAHQLYIIHFYDNMHDTIFFQSVCYSMFFSSILPLEHECWN